MNDRPPTTWPFPVPPEQVCELWCFVDRGNSYGDWYVERRGPLRNLLNYLAGMVEGEAVRITAGETLIAHGTTGAGLQVRNNGVCVGAWPAEAARRM